MGIAFSRRAPLLLVGVAALIAGTLTGPLTARPAMAGLVPCASDPVVSLSNGAQIDLSASIGTGMSSVTSVIYAVHAPAGTHVVAILNTDSVLGLVEHVNFYADNAANTYDTYTTVKTTTSGVPVTASSKVVSVFGLTLGLASIPGYSSQSLHLHFTSLL